MNRIVRDNYPADRLPEDLRELLDPNRTVRVVIEQIEVSASDGSLTRFAGRFSERDVSAHEAVARIRSLRQEWHT